MKKALFITMHPLGYRSGGSIASSNFLKVVLEAFEDQVRVVASEQSAAYVNKIGCKEFVPVSSRSLMQKVSYFLRGICSDRFSPYVDDHIEQLLDGVSHLVLDGSMLGRFAAVVKAIAPDVHITQLHHNCELKYYADTKMSFLMRLLMYRVININQGIGWRSADLNLTFTKKDLDDINLNYGLPLSAAVAYGYYEECEPLDILDQKKSDTNIRLVITGNMSVKKGYEGAVWFLEEVFPEMENATLTIAGRNPHKSLKELCLKHEDTVELISNPPDMLSVLRKADIFLNPSSAGSGIKVRNFDGLRSGLPVICHVDNAHGFEALPTATFCTFTDVNSFKDAFFKASSLCNPQGRVFVYNAYRSKFSLQEGVRQLLPLITSL